MLEEVQKIITSMLVLNTIKQIFPRVIIKSIDLYLFTAEFPKRKSLF